MAPRRAPADVDRRDVVSPAKGVKRAQDPELPARANRSLVRHADGCEVHPEPIGQTAHWVICIFCAGLFDLFTARWCRHRVSQCSKICPHCARCLCAHAAYGDPEYWAEAPPIFRKYGFKRLFILYA